MKPRVSEPEKCASSPIRSVKTAPGVVWVGATFTSWEAAQAAIYAHEEQLGHCWHMAQGKLDNAGKRKKIMFRCNRYHYPIPTHSSNIDPSDFRKGKSIMTGCNAHVNVNRVFNLTNFWHVTLTEWDHNHACKIPEGASIQRLPTADEEQGPTIFFVFTTLMAISKQNFIVPLDLNGVHLLLAFGQLIVQFLLMNLIDYGLFW